VATDAAQVVLMDDDLTQLRVLWDLAEGFERSLASNARRSLQFSLLAAAGVLALPFGFWTTELLWSVQVIAGVRIAQQRLLIAEVEDELGD
jgi:cation transport ATPase